MLILQTLYSGSSPWSPSPATTHTSKVGVYSEKALLLAEVCTLREKQMCRMGAVHTQDTGVDVSRTSQASFFLPLLSFIDLNLI